MVDFWHMAEEAALTGREVSPSFDVLDSVESTPEMSAVENLIEEEGLGKRSASPPGRQDWRAGERTRDETDANSRNPAGRSRSLSRSRSRSPGPGRRRVSSRERQRRYEIDGSNTTREEPHLQRARLFVGNIEPTKVHRRNLIQLFSEFGEVLGVSVHKGFAFIQMDRERSANKAINHLDNRVYMGSTIHVEFSQAALKAGARLERLPRRVSPTPPLRERPSDPYPLRQLERDQDFLREREERLTRILQMEKELALLRNRSEVYDSVPRRSRFEHPGLDRGAAASDAYQRASPPPVARDYHPSLAAQHPGYSLTPEERRSAYSRPPDRRLERSFERPPSPVHREPVSYPQLGAGRLSSNNLDRRDGFPSQYGGSSFGFSQHASGGGPSLPSANVGYGGNNMHPGSGGGRIGRALDHGKPAGLSGAPPGWPSTDFKGINRPPFASSSRWT